MNEIKVIDDGVKAKLAAIKVICQSDDDVSFIIIRVPKEKNISKGTLEKIERLIGLKK